MFVTGLAIVQQKNKKIIAEMLKSTYPFLHKYFVYCNPYILMFKGVVYLLKYIFTQKIRIEIYSEVIVFFL